MIRWCTTKLESWETVESETQWRMTLKTPSISLRSTPGLASIEKIDFLKIFNWSKHWSCVHQIKTYTNTYLITISEDRFN